MLGRSAVHRRPAYAAGIVAAVVRRAPEASYQYVDGRVGALAGVSAPEISLQLHQVEHAASLTDALRLTSPAPPPGRR
ncbi:hypothetical protein [Sphaerisporangium fuscum]|uniref:hypothetical protein n=1 Tax=Sphaerisporangium fuscum TaxID=2835868 RepID=UPI001BDC2EC4|nr:hypothetical protein [Sphaerisporangium fuscum]